MKKPIYTFGDSHAWHTWLRIPGVKTQPQGPMTMWTFGKREPLFPVPHGSILCFCAGEIDCRCHVHKHQPWQETIELLVERFLKAVARNESPETEIWIYNVVPPPKGIPGENPDFPFLGSGEERLSYVRYMNELLRRSKYKFVDIYKKCSDPEGFLLMEISDGHVHVEDEKPLMEWLEENNK